MPETKEKTATMPRLRPRAPRDLPRGPAGPKYRESSYAQKVLYALYTIEKYGADHEDAMRLEPSFYKREMARWRRLAPAWDTIRLKVRDALEPYARGIVQIARDVRNHVHFRNLKSEHKRRIEEMEWKDDNRQSKFDGRYDETGRELLELLYATQTVLRYGIYYDPLIMGESDRDNLREEKARWMRFGGPDTMRSIEQDLMAAVTTTQAERLIGVLADIRGPLEDMMKSGARWNRNR